MAPKKWPKPFDPECSPPCAQCGETLTQSNASRRQWDRGFIDRSSGRCKYCVEKDPWFEKRPPPGDLRPTQPANWLDKGAQEKSKQSKAHVQEPEKTPDTTRNKMPAPLANVRGLGVLGEVRACSLDHSGYLFSVRDR